MDNQKNNNSFKYLWTKTSTSIKSEVIIDVQTETMIKVLMLICLESWIGAFSKTFQTDIWTGGYLELLYQIIE